MSEAPRRPPSRDAMAQLLRVAGWEDARLAEVEIAGGDPVLATPFRIGDASAAALAAVGLAVSDVWQLRTGRRQDVAVDTRQAVASLRGGHYLRIDGKPLDTGSNPVYGGTVTPWGVYRARDGRWIYLHATRPPHLAAAMQVLGVPREEGAVRQAIAQWDAFELEEAVVAAGGAAGAARTTAEWEAHPQGRAVAALPLLEVVKIGESPPEPLPPGARPLSGVRVLDLTWVLAGPIGTRTLAEHGADVLRITAPHLPDAGATEYETGHGKLSAQLDLRRPADAALLRGLVANADVVADGYRPSALARRGLSPESLSELRPGIVVASLSAFGHVGPWAPRRGFDTVVQTVSGISSRQAEVFPGETPGPRFYPVSAIDCITGYVLAFGTLVALARRATEGGSWLVRVSLAQTGRWLLDQGEVPPAALGHLHAFTGDEVARWTTSTESPIGRLEHLLPVLRLSETPPYWERPAVGLGYHEPAWPARSVAGERTNVAPDA